MTDRILPDVTFTIEGGLAPSRYTGPLALDVMCALKDEAEDGSNLVTRMLDHTIENAIEDGSVFFVDTREETP